MKRTGGLVKIGKNDYVLGNELGGGTEGKVFDFNNKDIKFYDKYVIKLIDESKLSEIEKNERYEHLQWLKSKNTKENPLHKYVALPNTILLSDLGYVMAKTKGCSSLKKYLQVDYDNFDEWYLEKYTLKRRYLIIRSLFEALYHIHHEGLIFTDLSPNNIMVNDERYNIVFIDSDNMKRRTDAYNGVLGTPGYMAPEIYKNCNTNAKKISDDMDPKLLTNCGTLTVDSDIFSAAIIAFELLTLQKPFIGDEIVEGTADDEERALRCETDYIYKEKTTNTCSRMLCEYFEKLTTPKIRDLFYRTFVTGKYNPSLRPTDEEFYEAFTDASDSIVVCPKCKFESIYSKDCTVCENCKQHISNKVVLEIYYRHKDISRGNFINSMSNDGIFVGKGCDFDFDGNLKKDYLLLNSIVLETGVKKYIYLRHFESVMERNGKSCMAINISNTNPNDIYITINNRLLEVDEFKPFISNIKIITNTNLISLDPASNKEYYLSKYSNLTEVKEGRFLMISPDTEFNLEVTERKNNEPLINVKYKIKNFKSKYILFGEKTIGNVVTQIFGKFKEY